MSATRLLQLLESRGMLDRSVIADLRKQVAQSKYKVSAESIAKVLVDKGFLTRYQATKLVGEATAGGEATEKKPPGKKPEEEEEELWLAPEDAKELGLPTAEEVARRAGKPKTGRGEEEVILLEDASEEVEGLIPVVDAGARLTHVGPLVPGPPPPPLAPSPIDQPPPIPAAGTLPTPDPLALPETLPLFPPPVTVPPAVPQPRTRWETKLIFGGGLALALLLLIGFLLWWNLTKTPAITMFEAAMKDYRSESYSQAIAKFEKFLESYPRDEKASEARVRVVLARLWLAVADPQQGLESARALIPTIAAEKAFPEAREEFPSILPRIAEGFLKQAKATNNMQKAEELLAQAAAAMELVLDPGNIPTSLRSRIDTTVQRIQEDMVIVRRRIEQENGRVKAIQEIEKAIAADDTAAAYGIYASILKEYPALSGDEQLLASVRGIAERERKLVQVVDEPLSPLAPAGEAKSGAHVVLAARSGEGWTQARGQVAAVRAGASVYGLDAGNGQVLWRRFVGGETDFQPARLSDQPDADVLLVDGSRWELVRVRARTGEPVWRLPIGEPFAQPVLASGQLYVATHSGLLLQADLATGVCPRRAVIPQKLVASPAAVPDRGVFVAGERSNLYVLATGTLQCQDVHYVGHKPGTIDLPPLFLLNCLFVVENAGGDYALLHVLSLRGQGQGPLLKTAQNPIRLSGKVRVPPVPFGRRLLVLTERGEIRVFDVDLNDSKEPVKEAASLPAVHEEPLLGYPLTDGASLWVADDRLTNYRVQITTRQIHRDPNIGHVGDTFVAPLQRMRDLLIHVRRVKDAAGVTAAGTSIDNLRKCVWETQLEVPAAYLAPGRQQDAVVAVSAAGAVFEIDADSLAKTCIDQPSAAVGAAGAALCFTEAIRLAESRVLLCDPADRKRGLVWDPLRAAGPLKLVEWKLGEGRVTCTPVPFLDALLLPRDTGDVLLVDPLSGQSRSLPFQPRLEPGQRIAWRRPAVVGEGGGQFVIADDRQTVYRVGLRDQPRPFLAEEAKVQLEIQLTSGLAAAGNTVYGAAPSANKSTDVVVALRANDLKVAQEWDLQGGRVTWGPERVGNAVLVVIDGKQVRCFEAGEKERWQKPAPALGPPCGPPLLAGDDFVFASVDGSLWRISGKTGEQLGASKVGEPLSSGPAAYGEGQLLCAGDGVLHVVHMPTGS